MLGHTLYQTGYFGFPLEYANCDNLKNWQRLCGTSDAENTMRAVMSRRTSANGVFAIKLHYSHIAGLGGFSAVRQLFPNASYVLLTRSNVVNQAISFALARQTGIWIDGQEGDMSLARYDRALIDKCLRTVLRDNAAWKYQLAASSCRYMEVDFDSVKQDIGEAIKRIAQFAEVDLPADAIPPSPVTRKQGDSLNREWARRFLEDYDGSTLFPSGESGRFLRKLKSVKAAVGLLKIRQSPQLARNQAAIR